MTTLQPFSLTTNLYQGYPLEQALDFVRDCGFDYAELSSIYGMCEHVEPGRMTPDYAEQILQLLTARGLSCYALAGHVDPTLDEQCEMLLRKIEFAGRIGAHIVHTNAGPRHRIKEFHRNMKRLIAEAERWNVIIGLESHGDIISTARDSLPVFRYYHHPLVRLNYDTGNTYFFADGAIDIAEDLPYGEEYMAYLHLKDVAIEGQHARYTAIGSGDIPFPAIFGWLGTLGRPLPCALEIPLQMRGVLGRIGPVGAPLPPAVIQAAVADSLTVIRALL